MQVLTTSSPMVRYSYVFTIVENLGLCVNLTEDLEHVLNITFWLQIGAAILGIIGSLIAAKVSMVKKLRSAASVQLTCLALYDFVFLVCCLVVSALAVAGRWEDVAVKVFMAIRTLALWGATYTTLDICVERLISVAMPFVAHRRFTVRFSMKRALVILILGVLFTVPFVVDQVEYYSIGKDCDGSRQLTTFGLVYTLYISLLFLYLLPYTAIVVVNVFFAVLLCRLHRNTVRPMEDNSKAARELSALVLSLCAWYGICMMAPSMLFLVRLTRLELFEPNTDMRLAAAADSLVVLCACANFIFYFVLWRPFRQAMCEGMCGVDYSSRSSSYTTSSTDRHRITRETALNDG